MRVLRRVAVAGTLGWLEGAGSVGEAGRRGAGSVGASLGGGGGVGGR